jgi:hypothetical protein
MNILFFFCLLVVSAPPTCAGAPRSVALSTLWSAPPAGQPTLLLLRRRQRLLQNSFPALLVYIMEERERERKEKNMKFDELREK